MTDQPSQNDTFISSCTSCGLKLKVPSQYLGQKVKCSSCGTAFEARPAEETPAPTPAPKPEPAPERAPEPTPSAPERKRSSAKKMVEIDDSITPDSLMGDFKGKKLVVAILLAIILHAVLIVGTSYNYLKTEVFGKDTSEMSKDQKVQIALGEATSELSKIAERHGLSLEDITSKFSAGGSRSDKLNEPGAPATGTGETPASTGTSGTPTSDTPTPDVDPDDERSEMEKKMLKPEKGPQEPTLNVDDNMGL